MPDGELAWIVWDYLRYEQPLREADVIIGLGSHDLQTAAWCAELYHRELAPLIVFCGGRGRLTQDMVGSEADRYAEIAITSGVPDHAILRDTASTNTGENIVNAYQLLHEQGLSPRTVILATKPYMLRRAYATFMKQWPAEQKPDVICSSIDKDLANYGADFETMADTIEIMLGDLQRIREYPGRGFQIEQDIPSNVWAAYEQLVARGYRKHLIQ